MKKEKRIYVLDTKGIEWLEKKEHSQLTDEEFISYCEKQGGIFSLTGFAKSWNVRGLVEDIRGQQFKMRIL